MSVVCQLAQAAKYLHYSVPLSTGEGLGTEEVA